MRAHAFRLTPGSDLKLELERVVRARNLSAGCVLACVGSLSEARLRMPGEAGQAERFLALSEPLEIVALSGTLSPEGLHLHLALSRRDGGCVGGHLVPGCRVHTTAELVIGEFPELVFRRPLDPATGYGELTVESRACDDAELVTPS